MATTALPASSTREAAESFAVADAAGAGEVPLGEVLPPVARSTPAALHVAAYSAEIDTRQFDIHR